jgi:hypothetical protein
MYVRTFTEFLNAHFQVRKEMSPPPHPAFTLPTLKDFIKGKKDIWRDGDSKTFCGG